MSNETKQRMIVLDHSNGEIFVLPYNENVHPDAEEYLYEAVEEYEEMSNTRAKDCNWQIVTGDVKVTML